MANTPIRAVRVPDEIWHPAVEAARVSGTSVTAIVQRALREFVDASKQSKHSPS